MLRKIITHNSKFKTPFQVNDIEVKFFFPIWAVTVSVERSKQWHLSQQKKYQQRLIQNQTEYHMKNWTKIIIKHVKKVTNYGVVTPTNRLTTSWNFNLVFQPPKCLNLALSLSLYKFKLTFQQKKVTWLD